MLTQSRADLSDIVSPNYTEDDEEAYYRAL